MMFNRTAGLLAICEDLPEPHNRVTLDPERVDGNGIPAAKVTYRLSDNSHAMLAHGAARAAEALTAAGAKLTAPEVPMRVAGWAPDGHGQDGH